MASLILEQKCPACGAMMHFSPKEQKLVCDYCGTKVDVEPGKLSHDSIAEDFRFEEYSKGYEQPDAERLPIYNCRSCGAELIAPATQISLTCPYCRNNIVLTDKVSGSLRPNGIIPFKVTPEELPGKLTAFYKGRKLLPKDFFSKNAMSGVSGVYVPFWLFSGTLSGRVECVGTKTTSYSTSDERVTNTDYYAISMDVTVPFRDLPVDASAKIDDALMDTLEPFDMREVKPFEPGYLAGYTADRFDTPSDDLERRALARMESTVGSMLVKQSGYASIQRTKSALKPELTAKYYLLPVYLFKMKYANKEFPFAVNGQTGKIIGDLPDFKGRAWLFFFKRFAILAAAIIAVFVLVYVIGG